MRSLEKQDQGKEEQDPFHVDAITSTNVFFNFLIYSWIVFVCVENVEVYMIFVELNVASSLGLFSLLTCIP